MGASQGLPAADGHVQAITGFSVCGELLKSDTQTTKNNRKLLKAKQMAKVLLSMWIG